MVMGRGRVSSKTSVRARDKGKDRGTGKAASQDGAGGTALHVQGQTARVLLRKAGRLCLSSATRTSQRPCISMQCGGLSLILTMLSW